MDTLLHVFPSFAMGGAQTRTIDLANTILAEKRHIFVSLDRNFSAAEGLKGHVHHALLSIGCRRSGGLDLDNLRLFRRLVAERRPAALLTYNWGAIDAALANRIAPLCPHLHFEDGFGPDEAAGAQLQRRIWARRIALSGRSTIVVPSKTLMGVARSIWRFRKTRLHYIPNGIDCTRFDQPKLDGTAPLRRQADEVLIGTVSALRAEKNVARLLRLFAKLSTAQPLRLVIAGDGPERQALEAEADRLGIAARTSFLGAVAEPERILAQLDLFALTSDTEQMPYCLIEAMAAGLPLVVTDVGDVASMLPTANQPFIAPPEAETLLAAQLQRLVDRPDLRTTIGDLNRRHARERFDRRAMLERYHQLFSNLLPG
ncbi:MAG: glycosyltransferase family 4 protein [Alphaproteobacteria bacterium]